MRACVVCGAHLSPPRLRKGAWTYLRCPFCGLLGLDPLPEAETIEEHYRHKFESGNYAVALRNADVYRRVHEQTADWIAPREGDRVLDVGTFTGALVEGLSQRGADAYGLELQEEAVAIANERTGGRVYQADVHGTSFPEGPYDIISMIALIEHVLDPRQMVRRAHELMRPGGRLYLETPDAGSAPARALRAAWPPLAPVEHIHLFTRKSLGLLLAQEGFHELAFRRHVKRLTVRFVYEQLATFGGARWQRLLAPFLPVLGDTVLPFYVGEMYCSGRRL